MEINILIVTGDQDVVLFARKALATYNTVTRTVTVHSATNFVAAQACLKQIAFDAILLTGRFPFYSDSPGPDMYASVNLVHMILSEKIPCGNILLCPEDSKSESAARSMQLPDGQLTIAKKFELDRTSRIALCIELAENHKKGVV